MFSTLVTCDCQHDGWIHVIPSDHYSPNMRDVGSEIMGIGYPGDTDDDYLWIGSLYNGLYSQVYNLYESHDNNAWVQIPSNGEILRRMVLPHHTDGIHHCVFDCYEGIPTPSTIHIRLAESIIQKWDIL